MTSIWNMEVSIPCLVFFRRTMCNVLRKMVLYKILSSIQFQPLCSSRPIMGPNAHNTLSIPAQYGAVPRFRQFSTAQRAPGGGRCVARGRAACAGQRPQAPRRAPSRRSAGAGKGGGATGYRTGAAAGGGRTGAGVDLRCLAAFVGGRQCRPFSALPFSILR